MTEENLSYVIKRIISFFHTPQHDTVHIEKTRRNSLSFIIGMEWCVCERVYLARTDKRNNTNYSLHVLVQLFQRAARDVLNHDLPLFLCTKNFSCHFWDRILIEVLEFRMVDHSERVWKRL